MAFIPAPENLKGFPKTGHHLGEYDPDTGQMKKQAEPGRRIEV